MHSRAGAPAYGDGVTSPGSGAASASRRSPTSPLRRTAQIVLVAGTVLALSAAFGPLWVTRVGIALAVAAAVLACVFAWREIAAARHAHARSMLESSRAHGRMLSEERTRNAAVVDTLSARARDAGSQLEGQRGTIAELRTQVSSLRGDRVFLKSEVEHREVVIASLRETVRAREAELIALHAGEDGEADVHHLPRRVLAEHESVWADVPAADELWADGNHPTVVDLQMLDLAMVLPNYEGTREVG